MIIVNFAIQIPNIKIVFDSIRGHYYKKTITFFNYIGRRLKTE